MGAWQIFSHCALFERFISTKPGKSARTLFGWTVSKRLNISCRVSTLLFISQLAIGGRRARSHGFHSTLSPVFAPPFSVSSFARKSRDVLLNHKTSYAKGTAWVASYYCFFIYNIREILDSFATRVKNTIVHWMPLTKAQNPSYTPAFSSRPQGQW